MQKNPFKDRSILMYVDGNQGWLLGSGFSVGFMSEILGQGLERKSRHREEHE